MGTGRAVWVWGLGELFGYGDWESCLDMGTGRAVWVWGLGELFGYGDWESCLGMGTGRAVWEAFKGDVGLMSIGD